MDISSLREKLKGKLYDGALYRKIYATDASVYRILPRAVAVPECEEDLRQLISFASEYKIGLIPRAAGTSLAGQCVGDGIVVDISQYFTKIISIDAENRTVTVEPGVIRDDLNRQLKPYGLFFGPDTSTTNRCMIGGMVGNNSSGTTSIKYGVTRGKVLEMETILSDGSVVVFKELTYEEFFQKTKLDTLEGSIYKTIYEKLASETVRKEILEKFPDPEIHRRNTGYALDELIKSEIFTPGGNKFNMCKLLTGSEGTLAFTTKITLSLDPLPPSSVVVVAAHFSSIENCLNTVVPAMAHDLYACEMMDKVILDCTKDNLKYRENRSFIEGDPKAILLLELRAIDLKEALDKADNLVSELTKTGFSYAVPLLLDEEIEKALELRKAGLGLLGNITGDKKAVACIEDTAVAVKHLSSYITEFTALMKSYNQNAVYYAHAGAGELHLRPILNLKKEDDVVLFKKITTDVAGLVKKYSGSLSGEHGDGIVRSSYIPMMLGEKNYQLIKEIKHAFDPLHIFNPGKITDSLPMDKNLRYEPGREEPQVNTIMDFEDAEGILRLAEKCNGSGDCRKPESAGGTMCPSYRVTLEEKDSTRGRANALREFLTHSDRENRFDHKELKEVFDLCISCKGCKSECPSNVDVAALKAEFEYQYRKTNGTSLRDKFFASNYTYSCLGSKAKGISNFLLSNGFSSLLLKKTMGIAAQRSLPPISSNNLRNEFQLIKNQYNTFGNKIYFFLDEFTEFQDGGLGGDAFHLLFSLGYDLQLISHSQSGRAFISKGFLKEAKECANENINIYKDIISEESPLIGIEPSAILSFRDEYLRLAEDKQAAQKISCHTYTIDEFLSREIAKGKITSASFTAERAKVKLHGHCHQKALSSIIHSFNILNLPENYEVTVIPSGCCGMAGSFGYEKEHYEISMRMGELTLFPAIRKASEETIIAATGTSCRHQIKDGTGRQAIHPVSVLRNALKIKL